MNKFLTYRREEDASKYYPIGSVIFCGTIAFFMMPLKNRNKLEKEEERGSLSFEKTLGAKGRNRWKRQFINRK